MQRCQCTIVLGLPHIFVQSGRIKHGDSEQKFTLATEWNQIEAAVALTLKMPTLALLHGTVEARGIFERGSADLFVHKFNVTERDWVESLKPALAALRAAVDA